MRSVKTLLALPFAAAELVAGASGTDGGPGGQATQTQRAGALIVTVRVSPAAYGVNTVDALVRDGQGAPLAGAQVSAEATMADMDMGAQATPLAPVGEGSPGAYRGQADLTMPGRWEIAVRVRPPGGAEARATFAITVAPPRTVG